MPFSNIVLVPMVVSEYLQKHLYKAYHINNKLSSKPMLIYYLIVA